jgi:hypothetical protein
MNLYSHLDNFETGCLSCIQRGFGFTRNYIIPSILLLKMYTIYKLNEYTSLLLNVKDYDGIREELEEEQERLEEFKQSQSYSHSNEEIEPSCPKWFLAMDAIPLTQIELRSIQDEEQEQEQEEDEDDSTISSSESEAQNEQESENQSVSSSESQSDIDNEPHGEPPEENDENVSDSDETKSQNTSSEIVSEAEPEEPEEPEEESENRPLEYPPENPITIDTMIPEHLPEGCLTAYQALLLAELNPRMYKVMVVFMDGQMKTFFGNERIERSS